MRSRAPWARICWRLASRCDLVACSAPRGRRRDSSALIERIAKANFVNKHRPLDANDAKLEPRERGIARVGSLDPSPKPPFNAGMFGFDLIDGKRAFGGGGFSSSRCRRVLATRRAFSTATGVAAGAADCVDMNSLSVAGERESAERMSHGPTAPGRAYPYSFLILAIRR